MGKTSFWGGWWWGRNRWRAGQTADFECNKPTWCLLVSVAMVSRAWNFELFQLRTSLNLNTPKKKPSPHHTQFHHFPSHPKKLQYQLHAKRTFECIYIYIYTYYISTVPFPSSFGIFGRLLPVQEHLRDSVEGTLRLKRLLSADSEARKPLGKSCLIHEDMWV